MSSVPTGIETESIDTKNPQKQVPVPVPNIWYGTIRYFRVNTGTENVKSQYRIDTKNITVSVNSVPVPVQVPFAYPIQNNRTNPITKKRKLIR
ncbi:hypothetical protein HanIR_Chr10g0500931 [Helianthus annuus]|nr:hypothetical protein HanIR_Chr10g0500931 [Helianthus annuus]